MIKIEEGKQVGVLYHYTNLSTVLTILSEDILKCYRGGALSFTRNSSFHKSWRFMISTEARFVIDGDKLSEKYAIEPYNDFQSDIQTHWDKKLESEERIINRSVTDFSKYILAIDIFEPALDRYSFEVPSVIEMFRYLDHEGIEVNRKAWTVSSVYIKEYITRKYGIKCNLTYYSKKLRMAESDDRSGEAAMKEYLTASHHGINGYLRNGQAINKDFTQDLVDKIDSYISKAPKLKSGTVLYRGSSLDELGLRGKPSEQLAASINRELKDTDLLFKSFVSTSRELLDSYNNGLVFKIKVKREFKGADVSGISGVAWEKEVVLPRNISLTIQGASYDKKLDAIIVDTVY